MYQFGIGQPVRRVEDRRFITGHGQFVDDINLPHQCYGVVVMSPHAHARIAHVDVRSAQTNAGVVCVLTGADVVVDQLGGMPPLFMPDDHGGSRSFRTSRPILVSDRVRCVGDRVAFVIAETLVQAYDAAELIEIEYEPLTVTTDLEEAVKDGAFRIWDNCPTGNVSFEFACGDKAATDAAFLRADHVVGLRLENNRITANSLEPRAAIGAYDFSDDSYTLYTSSQNPHGVRSLAARQVSQGIRA